MQLQGFILALFTDKSFIVVESVMLFFLAFVLVLLDKEERQIVLTLLGKSIIIIALIVAVVYLGTEIIKNACI